MTLDKVLMFAGLFLTMTLAAPVDAREAHAAGHRNAGAHREHREPKHRDEKASRRHRHRHERKRHHGRGRDVYIVRPPLARPCYGPMVNNPCWVPGPSIVIAPGSIEVYPNRVR